MKYELQQLIKTYNTYDNIVIGVDFDDTLMPSDFTDEFSVRRCEEVVKLVKSLAPYTTLCMWTVADEQSVRYKEFIARKVFGIDFDYINDSPLKWHGNPAKKHFNILLDDKAGLDDTIDTLTKFKEYLLDE